MASRGLDDPSNMPYTDNAFDKYYYHKHKDYIK
jgi:hypothetical protein